MLTIVVPEIDDYDPKTQTFTFYKKEVLTLEHSLVSISKWESKWKKPFLSEEEKTPEEILDYIRCMTVSPANVDPIVYTHLPMSAIKRINEYIADPMTATTIREERGAKRSREIITSELIYYWMIALQIPFECQKWHLSRLMTLIRICNIKNEPEKKMSRGEIYRQNSALNAARRKMHGTKG